MPPTSYTLQELEDFQRVLITPIIDPLRTDINSLRAEISKGLLAIASEHKQTADTLAKEMAELEKRVNALEGIKAKALMGWTGLIAILTLAFNYLWKKFAGGE